MYSPSELADWWEKNRRESEKALNDFVDAHPNWWVIAAVTQTAIDVGAGTVDVLRFGEGAAESYETGKISPVIQDVFRGLAIAGGAAKAAQYGRPVLGRVIGLYADPGGGICAPLAIGNALRRTGQRFLLSLDDIARAHGLPGISSVSNLNMTQSINALRRLGLNFRKIENAASFENLASIARQGDGVVMFRIMSNKGGVGHRILLERVRGGVRIVDRTGFYNSLEELSNRYGGVLKGGKFVVDPGAPAVFVRQVTAKLLNGIPTLMVYANAVVGLSRNKTITELDAEFQNFKAQGGAGTSPSGTPTAGAQRITVARGDTLSGLAARYYGSFEYWPLIWDANRTTVGPNPNRITLGMSLQIPPLSGFSESQLQDARRRHPTWRNYGS